MNNGEWIGLDPTSGPLERKEERTLRPRPDALDGQVIGLVANGLGRGELLLDRVYEHLSANAEVTGAVRVLKSSMIMSNAFLSSTASTISRCNSVRELFIQRGSGPFYIQLVHNNIPINICWQYYFG